MMKTLIQKDLRENFKLAVIGLVIFSGLLFYAFHANLAALDRLLDQRYSASGNYLQPVMSTAVLWMAGVFCGLFGALVGWVQTRNEAHRDLWAFLVHRPVTRTEIFWAKAVAGLSLYLVGAGVPLAVLIVVVRMPGQVAAPFEWLMVLPLAGFFLAGIAAYFAGMLTGLRQARWFASRSLGLGLVFFGYLGLLAFPQWWQPLLGLVLALGVLGWAAWGAYQSGGFYRGQHWTGKVALTAAITVGCFTVVGAALLLLTSLFGGHTVTPFQQTRYEMTREGAIYKVTSTMLGETVKIEDLAGQPLMDPKTGQRMEWKDFSARMAFRPYLADRFQPASMNNPLYEQTGFFILLSVTDKTLWYLDRHGRLMGFDGPTRKSIGALAPRDADRQAGGEPFLVENSFGRFYSQEQIDRPRRFIASDRSIYLLDFQQRTVAPLLNLTNEEVRSFENPGRYYGFGEDRSFAFTTDQAVYNIDSLGHTIFRVPIDPSYKPHPQISVTWLTPGREATNAFAVWFSPGMVNGELNTNLPVKVEWIGPGGIWVTPARALPALPVVFASLQETWADQVGEWLDPPITGIIATVYGICHHGPVNQIVWRGTPLAVLCTLAGCWLARRHDFSRASALGWATFVLIFGFPGLMAFGCVQEWPARVRCPGCQQPRSVGRETCEHCGAAFPPPEKNGTEIFEALASENRLAN